MNTPNQTPEPAAEEPQSFGTPVDLGRLVSALWRARLWLVLAFIVGAGGGIALAKALFPHSYDALAVLRHDGFSPLPGITNARETALSELQNAFVATPVLKATRERLGEEIPIKALKMRIRTSAAKELDTVGVSYSGSSPEKALEGIETLMDEARQYSMEQRRGVIQAQLERVEARVQKQERDVEEVRERYKAFRKEHGIADLSAERRDGMQGAASLQAQRDMTEAEIRALEAQVRQLESQVRSAPTMEVSSSAVSNPDQERLASLEAELAEARSSLSSQHPRVRSLELQVDNLRSRVRSGEAKTVSRSTMTRSTTRSSAQADLSSLRGKLLAAKEQFASLSTLAAEAQDKVKRFSEVEGQAVGMMSQLKVAESLLTTMREERGTLKAALQTPEVGFTVIDEPVLPETPSANAARKKLALVVPVALLLLVVAQALLRELWGARIITPGELGFWGKGPVLAASTWPRDATAYEELVADFDDCAPFAHGETLMVAASENVLEATGELARRLHQEWFDNAVVVQTRVDSQLPRTRALASGDAPRGGGGKTIELWRSPPENESHDSRDFAVAGGHGSVPPGASSGRVVFWSGGMDGHGLRRASRLADRVVVVVEAGALNPASLKAVRAAIARDTGVGYILVSAHEAISQGRDRVGPVMEFWRTAAT